jgi:hypothetical protein
MNKRCILNVATGEFYRKMQDRLYHSFFPNSIDCHGVYTTNGFNFYGRDSLKTGIDMLLWDNVLPAGSRPHSESPYGFKVHAIKAAYEMGYTSVLWLDSPAYTVKEDISPIFEKIEKEGYYAMSHVDPLENYVGDYALEHFGISREDLKGYNLPSGSCYGFDFTKQGFPLIVDLAECERKGLFRNEVKGNIVHRHDEAILALSLLQNELPVFTFDPLFQSDSPECVIRSGGEVMKTDDSNLKIGRYHGE